MLNRVSHHLDGIRSTDNLSDAEIWIVDDDLHVCAFAEAHLKAFGFAHCYAIHSGEECWKALKKSPAPDLILLDINMPGMSGLEVLKKIRSKKRFAHLPILVMTGVEEAHIRNEAIVLGANSIVSKPFDPAVIITQVQQLVKVDRLTSQLEAYKSRVSAEIQTAERLQNCLLPDETELRACGDHLGMNFSFVLHSSSELSGDFWGLKPAGERAVAIYMADIVGHGVAAAANTYRLHEILSDECFDPEKPIDFMENVNRRFYERTPPEVFASLIVGTIDLAKGLFTYVSAMAPCPVLWRCDAKAPLMLYSSGVPLGTTAKPDFESHSVPFSEQDRLFFYSDALTEAPTKIGDRLGPLTPCDYLTKAMAEDAAEIIPRVEDQFFSDIDGPLHDDLTLLVIEPNKTEAPV